MSRLDHLSLNLPGGIIARCASDVASEKLVQRLETGAVVKERSTSYLPKATADHGNANLPE